MSTLHTIVQKSLLSLFALCFMFVAIYVPQNWNKVHEAEAGFATTGLQIVQQAQLLLIDSFTYLTSVATAAIEWFQSNLYAKEFVLDGFAWYVIKLAIAQITRSIVNWINSGFEGAPTFVQDIEGFLLGVGGQAAGLYLQQLGMPGLTAFICAPFRLNIQIAFATSYKMARSGFPYHTMRCNIQSGILGNFVGGNFNGGGMGTGWDNWYRVSTQSNTYTPYGSLMASQHEASLRMRTSIGVENSFLQFGNGFFSNKICDTVSNPSFPKSKCMVSTPGNVISEALNFQLSTGVRSMIAADEINEIIGALMGQVAQTALMGVNGLLGMSSNTGYTDPAFAGSYIDQQASQQQSSASATMTKYLETLDAKIATENNYITLINSAIPLLQKLNTIESNKEALLAADIKIVAQKNLDALIKIKADLLAGTRPISELLAEYSNLPLHTDTEVKASEDKWMGLFLSEYSASVNIVNASISLISQYLPLLTTLANNGSISAAQQVNLINSTYSPALAKQKAELDKIAIEWNDPAIPKVNTLQHYLNLRNGAIAGVPALFTQQQYENAATLWSKITGV